MAVVSGHMHNLRITAANNIDRLAWTAAPMRARMLAAYDLVVRSNWQHNAQVVLDFWVRKLRVLNLSVGDARNEWRRLIIQSNRAALIGCIGWRYPT